MSDSNQNNQEIAAAANQAEEAPKEEAVKWDYTNREQTLYTGAAVVALNLLVIVVVVLDRTVPAIHTFITGKTM